METAADAFVVGFVSVGVGVEDKELGMEDEPPERVVLGLPCGMTGGGGAGVGGLTEVAGFDDGVEETQEGFVEGGLGEVTDASPGFGRTRLDGAVDEL